MAQSSAPSRQRGHVDRREPAYRTVKIRVPDTRAPGFADRIRREMEAVSIDDGDRNILVWLDHAQRDIGLPPYEIDDLISNERSAD